MFEARKLYGLLFILLLLTTAAFGQEFTGSITGRVSDSSGAVIPGVTITLSGTTIQGVRTAISGETGAYQFLLVPGGTYTLRFELPGFKTINHEGVIVQVQKATQINESMEVAATAETVNVTGESPVVDVQNATVAVNFNQAMLRDIPNSRDIWIVLGQSPGINVAGRYDVGGSTMGSQSQFRAYGVSGQNTFNLDGINTTDGSGSAGWYFDYGSFSEIQVSAAANAAEVQTPGAFMNTVIKSGGNEFHGQVYVDWEDSRFQGTNVSSDMARTCPNTVAAAMAFTGPCGLFTLDAQGNHIPGGDRYAQYNDFNAQAGGALKKDKLWWFFSWRNQWSDLVTQLGLKDSAEDVYGMPLNNTSIVPGGHFTTLLRIPTLKFNYQITPKNQFVFLWQHSRKLQPFKQGQGGNAYQYINESNTDQHDPSDGRKVELTSILSPRLTLDAKVTDSEYIFPLYARVEKPPISDTVTLYKRGGGPNPFVEWRKHWDWGGNVSYFKEGLAGNHNFKTGYDVYYESTRDYTLTFPGGGYSLSLTAGVPNQFSIRDPYTSENAVFQNAFYLQDKWQIGRKLTVNIGMRWDHYHPYYPAQENPGDGPFGDPANLNLPANAAIPIKSIPKTYVATFNNVVPRVAFSYDVFGDGKTAIKASAGKYSWNPSFSLASSANPNRGGTYTFKWLIDPATGIGVLPITPAYVAAHAKDPGFFVSSSVPTSTAVDPNISNSWTDEYTAGIEQQLINDLGLRFNFVRKIEQNPYASVNTAQDISSFTPITVNDPGPDAITGTADDQPIVIYNLLPQFKGVNKTSIQNFKGIGGNFSTIEFSMTKRMSNKWMGLVGFDRTKRNPRQDISLDPNTLNWGANSNVHYWDWSFKSVFQYEFPYGIDFTTTFNSQKGESYVRTISIPSSVLNQGTTTITVGHLGQNFYPTVKLWNARAEKEFKINERQRLAAMFDLFNIPNQNTATAWATSSTASSTTFDYQRRITAILNPRIFRLGARYTF
jgi:hypothetical protein